MKSIPRMFFDGVYRDYKRLHTEIIMRGIINSQLIGHINDGVIIPFFSRTANDIAYAVYSFKTHQVTGITCRYWHSEIDSPYIFTMKVSNCFNKTWQTPLPVREYNSSVIVRDIIANSKGEYSATLDTHKEPIKQRHTRYDVFSFTGKQHTFQFNHYLN